MVKPIHTLAITLAVITGLTACNKDNHVILAVNENTAITAAIGEDLTTFLNNSPDFTLQTIAQSGGDSNTLELLQTGKADLGVIFNGIRSQTGIRTIIPLYTGVLHILYRKENDPQDIVQLLDGKTVLAGEEGSIPRRLIKQVAFSQGIELNVSYVDQVDREAMGNVDVIALVGPVSPWLARQMTGFRLFSLGEVNNLGRGSIAEGLTFMFPELEPFVIPANTYGAANPEPVLTLSVDSILVASARLDDELVYELTRYIINEQPALATSNPTYFHAVGEDFSPGSLSLPLHPGARQFYERDRPSLIERYAELLGVILSATLALAGGLLALRRWNLHRKKDRIDEYYSRALTERQTVTGSDDTAVLLDCMKRLMDLEDRAFEQLVQEQLKGDENFLIFVSLVHQIMNELNRKLGRYE
jgi:TRAP-type uncharacterized transport system substrate-binding protein